MKTADCGQFDDAPVANRLCDSGMRRVLAKAEMCPRSVVVFHVLRQNPSEMPRAPAALLEVLVHFELDLRDLLARYRLLKLHAPDELTVERVTPRDLPEGWFERTNLTRAMGGRWLETGRSPLLTVPSALVPETFNVLLNPVHPDAQRIAVVQVSAHVIDPRLMR